MTVTVYPCRKFYRDIYAVYFTRASATPNPLVRGSTSIATTGASIMLRTIGSKWAGYVASIVVITYVTRK